MNRLALANGFPLSNRFPVVHVNSSIYMDHHATTPVDARVVEAMLPFFSESFGNPGSINHVYGWEADEAVEAARNAIAAAIGAEPKEIAFTSGATESANLAIYGVCQREPRKGTHLLSVSTEHRAVLDPLRRLARREFDVTWLDVAPHGREDAGLITAGQVADALRDDTLLVSVMLANNEIGAIHPLEQIGDVCKQRGVLLHCDASQAVGKIPIDVNRLQVDLMSFTAHKIYGPKGVGALYVRRRRPHVRLQPQIDGGGQERGLRSGTLNVPGIVGFARALEICLEEMPQETHRLRLLRDKLYERLVAELGEVYLNGPDLSQPEHRLAGNLNVSFAGVDGEALMTSLKNLAVSSGSACTSADPEPSHVLRALGLSEDLTRGSLRFGLGRSNVESHVELAVDSVVAAVRRLRSLGAAKSE